MILEFHVSPFPRNKLLKYRATGWRADYFWLVFAVVEKAGFADFLPRKFIILVIIKTVWPFWLFRQACPDDPSEFILVDQSNRALRNTAIYPAVRLNQSVFISAIFAIRDKPVETQKTLEVCVIVSLQLWIVPDPNNTPATCIKTPFLVFDLFIVSDQIPDDLFDTGQVNLRKMVPLSFDVVITTVWLVDKNAFHAGKPLNFCFTHPIETGGGKMATNEERATWAEQALQNFGDLTMGGELSKETITDLICDICHFAELNLGQDKDAVLKLVGAAIGAWSAERDAPDGEPIFNDSVLINITIQP